jgi:hypothetical protein
MGVEQGELSAAQTRFLRAVHVLAMSTDALPERVSAAWLELMALRRDDLPPTLQEAFGVIEAEMLTAPDDPLTLGDEAASTAAERILRLAVAVWSSGGGR